MRQLRINWCHRGPAALKLIPKSYSIMCIPSTKVNIYSPHSELQLQRKLRPKVHRSEYVRSCMWNGRRIRRRHVLTKTLRLEWNTISVPLWFVGYSTFITTKCCLGILHCNGFNSSSVVLPWQILVLFWEYIQFFLIASGDSGEACLSTTESCSFFNVIFFLFFSLANNNIPNNTKHT